MHLEISQVYKQFSTEKGNIVALENINMHVETGEFVCVVGASGSGKSTLLRLVAGLDFPTSGQITVDRQLVVEPGADRGMVFQKYTLYPWMNVQKNVEFGLRLAGMRDRQRREIASYYLDIVGLANFAKSLPKELSGGMKQRVAIARALATKPKNTFNGRTFWGIRYSNQRKYAAVSVRSLVKNRLYDFDDYS